MRYVSADHLMEGMVLGKPFYGRTGDLMLREGMVLTTTLVERIRNLRYSGVYIQDKFSEGIDPEDIISEDLRYNAATSVRRLMASTESEELTSVDMDGITQYVNRILEQIMSTKNAIINLVDLKEFDLYTYQHSVNVCVLCCVIGYAYGIPRKQLLSLAMASILHDIGKMFVDKKILDKPGKLSPEEFTIIKKHSRLGYECLEKCGISGSVTDAILMHHERFDGTGYPLGKKGDEVPIFAQIISIADVFDAITSKRSYHEAIVPSEAYEYILGNAGRHFAPKIVDVFTQKIAPFPLGVSVQLSNGLEGVVYKNHEGNLTRPVVKLFPLPGQKGDQFLDLKNDKHALGLTIKKILI